MRAFLPLALILATPALASTDAAWEAFREDVRVACEALVPDDGSTATLTVNPFGSESYGVALVDLEYEAGTDRMICVYDKAAGTAELSAPFLPEE